MNHSFPEALVVLKAQTGCDRSFEQLHENYAGQLKGFVISIAGAEHAEDILQETWLSAYQRISTLTSPRAFKKWLFTLARNKSIDKVRVLNRVEFEQIPDEMPDTAQTGPELEEDKLALFQKLASTLPDAHREVAYLFYKQSFTVEEISIISGIPPGTVKSRLHTARQLLMSKSQENKR